MSMSLVLYLHIFSCVFMTGVIWLVQILVYPAFRNLAQTDHQNFHRFHTERITWVVAPVMLIELLTAVGLAWMSPQLIYFLNLGSVVALWLLTALVSVPLHDRISRGESTVFGALIWTNGPRTALWSARLVFWFWFIQTHAKGLVDG